MLSVLHTYLRGGRQSPEMNACRFPSGGLPGLPVEPLGCSLAVR